MRFIDWLTGRDITAAAERRAAEARESAARRAKLRPQECPACGRRIGAYEEVLIVHVSLRHGADELDAVVEPYKFVHLACIINKTGATEGAYARREPRNEGA